MLVGVAPILLSFQTSALSRPPLLAPSQCLAHLQQLQHLYQPQQTWLRVTCNNQRNSTHRFMPCTAHKWLVFARASLARALPPQRNPGAQRPFRKKGSLCGGGHLPEIAQDRTPNLRQTGGAWAHTRLQLRRHSACAEGPGAPLRNAAVP